MKERKPLPLAFEIFVSTSWLIAPALGIGITYLLMWNVLDEVDAGFGFVFGAAFFIAVFELISMIFQAVYLFREKYDSRRRTWAEYLSLLGFTCAIALIAMMIIFMIYAPILVELGFKLIIFIFAGLITFLLKRRANKKMKLNEDLEQKKLAVSQDSTDIL